MFGIKNPDNTEPPACGGKLPALLAARKLYSYGEQNDYWNSANCVGWVRRGTADKPDGVAVVLSNAEAGTIRMFVGEMHKGEVWTDVLGWESSEITISDDGWGDFVCPGISCAVWVRRDAPGREDFGKL